jgi:hypothetical protein
LGTSGHVTAKSSILPWGVLYKFGVYARSVLCLSLGDLPCALGSRVREKLAELCELGLGAPLTDNPLGALALSPITTDFGSLLIGTLFLYI